MGRRAVFHIPRLAQRRNVLPTPDLHLLHHLHKPPSSPNYSATIGAGPLSSVKNQAASARNHRSGGIASEKANTNRLNLSHCSSGAN